MNLMTLILIVLVATILNLLFFILGKKLKVELMQGTTFECGFSSYFFSRFSFSIHYFLIAMIFLFLDLELCFIMPYMNSSMLSKKMEIMMLIFVSALILGLTLEWKQGKLDWMF